MRIIVRILLFSTVLNTGRGRDPSPVLLESDAKIRIHKVTIDATGLPGRDRERVTHLFEHYRSLQDELQPLIERAFRNLGYFNARVDEPKISLIRQRQGTEDVDVSVKVDQGAQYRLGEIQFQKASLFPAGQMRALFEIRTGDLLSVTKITKGLDELRKLYATEGYIDMVANPGVRTNESRRTIALVLELDQGDLMTLVDFFSMEQSLIPMPIRDSWNPGSPARQAAQPAFAEELADGKCMGMARRRRFEPDRNQRGTRIAYRRHQASTSIGGSFLHFCQKNARRAPKSPNPLNQKDIELAG
jgi:hypothetical protein